MASNPSKNDDFVKVAYDPEDEVTREVHSNSRQIAFLGEKLALSAEEVSHWNTLLTRIHLTSNHEKAIWRELESTSRVTSSSITSFSRYDTLEVSSYFGFLLAIFTTVLFF